MTPDLRYLEQRVLQSNMFGKLIEDLGFPEVRTPVGILDGRNTWETYLRAASLVDRRNCLLRLEDVVTTLTPSSGRRWEAWRAAGSPDIVREYVREHIVVHGDLSLFPMVQEALARVPPSVRWATVFQSAFVLLNETRGFHMSAWFADHHGMMRERLIVLGPRSDVALTAHEIAHHWFSAYDHDQPPIVGVSALGGEGLRQLARSQGWEDQIDRYVSVNERAADALALCWLLRSEPPAERVQLPC